MSGTVDRNDFDEVPEPREWMLPANFGERDRDIAIRAKAVDYATRNNVAGNADSCLRDAFKYEDYIRNGQKEEGTSNE